VAANDQRAGAPSAVEVKLYRLGQWLRSPGPYLMLMGYGLLLGFWYLSVEVLRLRASPKCPVRPPSFANG
jgi:NitT/TauT family transport system permease protein